MKTRNDHEQARRAYIRAERAQLIGLVATVLRSTREDQDVKQKQMGYLMDRSADVISNIECGRTDPSMVDVLLWARQLNVDPMYVFEEILFNVRKYYRRGG